MLVPNCREVALKRVSCIFPVVQCSLDGAIVMAQLAERLLRKQRSLVRIQSSTKFYNKQLLTVEKMNIKKNEAGKDGTFCKFLCCGGITQSGMQLRENGRCFHKCKQLHPKQKHFKTITLFEGQILIFSMYQDIIQSKRRSV